MSTNRRIVFVAPFGLGKKATVWARILPLARVLAGRGHHVSLLIPPWDTPGDAGRTWVEDGVEVVNVSLSHGPPRVLARLVRAALARNPDIVHVVKPRAYAGLVQWWLWQQKHLGRGPACLMLDLDDWEQAWAPVNQHGPLMTRALAWQEEWGIRHADAVTVASRWLEQRVHRYTPHTPVLYLPNGIEWTGNAQKPESTDPAQREAGNPNNPPRTILYFTRFIEVGPRWLAEFWQAVRASLPDAELVVAGEAVRAQAEASFKQSLASFESPSLEAISWPGFVPPSKLAQLYAAAQCAIFPAENVPLMQAKCSVKLANVLLSGVPVVASAVGEQANYGADGAAHLVPPDATPAEFAAAVVDVLLNPIARRTLSAKARQRLLTVYHWGGLGSQLDSFYDQVCARPRE